MCTLILGRDVIAPGSVLLAANRDEDPARFADPPGVLRAAPRLVGGRDRRAGGTWLAVREGRAVAAVLNRRDAAGQPAPPAPGRRSRGSLVLDVAAADENAPRGESDGGAALAGAARRRALAALDGGGFAPFTLVFATAGAAWHLAHDAIGEPRFAEVSPGWHVVTHADLDDPGEPRTRWLMGELARFRPRGLADAEARLDELLRSHGDPGLGVPAVCLHEGRMVTVSASSVWLAAGQVPYRHVEGRPCERPLADRSQLVQTRATRGRER